LTSIRRHIKLVWLVPSSRVTPKEMNSIDVPSIMFVGRNGKFVLHVFIFPFGTLMLSNPWYPISIAKGR